MESNNPIEDRIVELSSVKLSELQARLQHTKPYREYELQRDPKFCHILTFQINRNHEICESSFAVLACDSAEELEANAVKQKVDGMYLRPVLFEFDPNDDHPWNTLMNYIEAEQYEPQY